MLNRLLFANIALPITHQIDAAYRHEWEMFQHAGFAIAGFTQFHLPTSIGVIIVSFVVAVSLAVVTLRLRASFKQA